jgi:hypothetical protein
MCREFIAADTCTYGGTELAPTQLSRHRPAVLTHRPGHLRGEWLILVPPSLSAQEIIRSTAQRLLAPLMLKCTGDVTESAIRGFAYVLSRSRIVNTPSRGRPPMCRFASN